MREKILDPFNQPNNSAERRLGVTPQRDQNRAQERAQRYQENKGLAIVDDEGRVIGDGVRKLAITGAGATVDVLGDVATVDISAGGGGGAPTTATYITQTADAGLSAEQALSSLATGIVKNTTGTGVLSIATAGTDYYNPGGTDVAVADGGTGASTAANARTNLELVAGATGDIWVEKAGDTMTGALVINVNTAGALSVQNGSGVDLFLFDALNDRIHGHSGADIILYSDAGTTPKIGLFGNNGYLVFGDDGATQVSFRSGSGSPEGVVTAVIGSLYSRTDGGTDTAVYRKESGTGNTGWVAVSSSGSGLTHPQVISRLWLVG